MPIIHAFNHHGTEKECDRNSKIVFLHKIVFFSIFARERTCFLHDYLTLHKVIYRFSQD